MLNILQRLKQTGDLSLLLQRREWRDLSKEECLEGSIIKWEALSQSTHAVEHNGDSCPLCHKYAHEGNLCKGCPVSAASGHSNCKGTPFVDFNAWPSTANADDEVIFLKGLRQRTASELLGALYNDIEDQLLDDDEIQEQLMLINTRLNYELGNKNKVG